MVVSISKNFSGSTLLVSYCLSGNRTFHTELLDTNKEIMVENLLKNEENIVCFIFE